MSTIAVSVLLAFTAFQAGGGRAVKVAEARAPSGNQDASAADDTFDPKPFRIRDTQAVKWQLDEVQGHIAARRWSEAIDGLQTLLEEHPGDVLAPEFARLPSGTKASQATHHGAAPRARALLFELPREARRLYRERHEGEANAALLHAWERLDRRALWEVVRRYPLTLSAQRAAWTLGDLEWERGHGPEALAAWSHALALLLDKDELVLESGRDWQQALARVRDLASAAKEADGADTSPSTAHGAPPASAKGASEAAIARRVLAATDWLAARAGEASARAGQKSARGVRPPGRDADSWFEPYVLPGHPFVNAQLELLHPARNDATLFVSTSLRLLALDAYSGQLAWRSEEPAGWARLSDRQRNDFFRGADLRNAWIQPATGERVVVAGLQIPVSFVRNENFQNDIGITRIMPDRRLFAFDAKDGTPLWNHTPPANWDGDAGTFVERMSLAGPPIVVGSRVLAPCYRMQGRIDYHVGCFDLDTGALLWSTDVISGQRELNMFGRPEHEFCAPPLVVDGDRVIAETQLGAIASLDLYSGEVRWVTLYDQIPLQRVQGFGAPRRPEPWRNQPPVVAGSCIVAAPFDSFDLVGIDRDDGTLLWTLNNRNNSTIETLAGISGGRLDQLVGARDDTVYLAGECVLALRSPAGLANAAPMTRKWTFSHPEIERDGPSASCVLADDRLVVPTDSACLSIDLVSGRPVDEGLNWEDREDGNVLVCERELFALSNRKVDGYFEWGVLVQRARRAFEERPSDVNAALALGRLLANRGTSELERRGRSQEARETLVEARGVLERALDRTAGDGGDARRAELGPELHRVLRSLARALANLADTQGALEALRHARPLAPSTEELRDTLLEELALDSLRPVRGGAESPAELASREAILSELEQRCGALTILCDSSPAADGSDATDPATSTRGNAGDANRSGEPVPAVAGSDARASSDEPPFAFDPIVGGQSRANTIPIELPVALWTLTARERDAVRQNATGREFALLHRILAEHGDVQLFDGTAGERATARIGELLRSGRRGGYEPFAAQAEQEFQAASAAHDRERMQAVTRRFPFSPAAEKANDARLEWALEAGDVAEVARIVQSELPFHWSPATASARELGLCLRLAGAARRAGNVELADELVRSLATERPDTVPEIRGSGPAAHDADGSAKTLAELARGIGRAPLVLFEPLASPGRFGSNPKPIPEGTLPGEFELLGRCMPATTPPIAPRAANAGDVPSIEPDLLLGFTSNVPGFGNARRAATLYCFGVASPSARWYHGFPPGTGPIDSGVGPWADHVAVAPGRVFVAGADKLLAFDAETGEPRWSWSMPDPTPPFMSLAQQSGVVVLSTKSDEGVRLYAFDATTGAPLWQDGPQALDYQIEPLLSSNRVVSLPITAHTSMLVRDLFTGRHVLEVELEIPASQNIREQSWIEDDRLIVPRCGPPSKANYDQIQAIDLLTGRIAWRLAIGEIGGDRRYLTDVLQQGGRTYLLLKTALGKDVQNLQAGLFELSTSIGAVAPIHNVRLAPTDRIVGGRAEGRTRLGNPLLFVLSESQSQETRLRAIDLSSGELWSQGLGAKWDDLFPKYLSQPALSDTTVALCYGVLAHGGRDSASARSTYLALFDRATGVVRETRALDGRSAEREKAEQVTLYPFGDVLIVRGKSRVEFLR